MLAVSNGWYYSKAGWRTEEKERKNERTNETNRSRQSRIIFLRVGLFDRIKYAMTLTDAMLVITEMVLEIDREIDDFVWNPIASDASDWRTKKIFMPRRFTVSYQVVPYRRCLLVYVLYVVRPRWTLFVSIRFLNFSNDRLSKI